MKNERLSSSLALAETLSAAIDERSRRTHFTSETARAANEMKAAKGRKPKTAVIRVEADILDIIEAWPKSVRIAAISAAIRASAEAEIAKTPEK